MTSEKPLVSVVMANLNKGSYVTEAIKSVINQSYETWELLFVDNGSTDGSKETAQEMASVDNRIRVLSEPIRGLASALNAGLAGAKGELVTFLDSDDVASRDRLLRQVSLLISDPSVTGCHTNGWIIDEKGTPNGLLFHPDCVRLPPAALRGDIFHSLLEKNFVLGGSMMLWRNAFEGRVFDTKIEYGVDLDMWLRMSYAHKLAYVSEPLYGYRIYSGNTSWTLLWSNHPLIYEKCLRTLALNKEDKRIVIRRLFRLYRRNRNPARMAGLLISSATARRVVYDYLVRDHSS